MVVQQRLSTGWWRQGCQEGVGQQGCQQGGGHQGCQLREGVQQQEHLVGGRQGCLGGVGWLIFQKSLKIIMLAVLCESYDVLEWENDINFFNLM